MDDDEEFVAELLRFWRAPLAVRVVRSGKEAMKYLRARIPRLILLDLKLPRFLAAADELEGQAILSSVRSQCGGACPVVIVTEERSPDTKNRLLALGATAYLSKPVDVTELETIIECALK